MAVPRSHDMMKPILELLAEAADTMTTTDILDRLAQRYALTPADREERTPSGKSRYYNNATRAIGDLKAGGCLQQAGRALYRITPVGRAAIAANPGSDNLDGYLMQTSEAYRAFKTGRAGGARAPAAATEADATVSTLAAALQRGRNLILYGAPGTGKSHYARLLYAGHEHLVTTFHPDYDYTDFVGAYKPAVDREGRITYAFTPQVFTRAYSRAWKLYCDDLQEGGSPEGSPGSLSEAEPMYLGIEEINRGNCAQAFGDIFQLLDRDEEGFSRYAIACDHDLADWLARELGACPGYAQTICEREGLGDGFDYSYLMLPPNFYLLATMNTSDQSLFPMDSAFRRRWEWEYVAINYEAADGVVIQLEGRSYGWRDFLCRINERIGRVTLSEDKQLGPYFVRVPADRVISAGMFRSKVLFYLWHDVFRDEPDGVGNLFRYAAADGQGARQVNFSELYGPQGGDIMRYMLETGLGMEALPQDGA